MLGLVRETYRMSLELLINQKARKCSNKTKQTPNRRHIDGNAKEHRSRPKELPMAKAGAVRAKKKETHKMRQMSEKPN